MRIESLIRSVFAGEQSQVEQSINPEKENNSQLSTLNSQLEKTAVQIDSGRLKLIEELSRLISELKNQFPELAQSLSKARDYISVNQENIPIKSLMNLLSEIQVNLKESVPVETIKKLVDELIKILQPSSEIPVENKLILALSKNDFASANTAIKNIVAVPPATPLQTVQMQPQTTAGSQQTFQVILNALQELKELGIPKELQNTPLKELEAVALQKTGIEIPKDLAKNIFEILGEKPAFVAVNHDRLAPILEKILATIPQNAIQNTIQNPPQKIEMAFSLYQIIPSTASVTDPVPQAQAQPQIQPQAQPQIQPQAQPQIQFQIQPQAQLPIQPQIQPQAQPQIQFQIQPQAQLPIQPQIQPQAQPQIQPQIQPQAQLPIQPQAQMQTGETKFILQPWTASIALPREERDFWLKTDLPLTPQILNVRKAILSFGKLPENPEIARLFASGMHELSLLTEQGTSVSKEQMNLLWRVAQTAAANENHIPAQITQTFLKYQPLGNYEGDLFKNLPEPVKKELLQELPAGKTWQPEILQKAVEKVLEKYPEQPPTANLSEHTKAHEEIRNTLQNFKEQIQWTRIDQDTRLQNDRENVFYFMHEGELQKGRLKVRDERKGSSKNRQDSSISFKIETRAKNLGEVHADLTLSKGVLSIRLQDEFGAAGEAVKEEREALARELADIGIVLGELIYGKTPKLQNLPVAKKEKGSGGLDVMA